MIYYTSDLHLCHENVIMRNSRPFEDIDEMNETIIDNWNKKIDDDDIVYVLGDIGFPRNKEDVFKIIDLVKKLKGHKILILGNHDWRLLKVREFNELFEECTIYKEIIDNERRVVLMHYPIEDWNNRYHGSYHLFGHIHNNKISEIACRFNVGVDVNNFFPVTLDELIYNNK